MEEKTRANFDGNSQEEAGRKEGKKERNRASDNRVSALHADIKMIKMNNFCL